ncbi:hypothetical protein OG265_37325 (plasmid) [Streptomyces sp. NBC_01208]|uniref:hypothetical protein n=1 Tax=Streptomyces sp. NBC_01208 TaxID=2903773 RepID=UPI002E0D95E7|nr:hypothetical protein OG265_37325 [Streptomyces sp. NBC_01208]
MSLVHPVANGLRTDHPVPGLPFINDERLPLDNPDAIERTGRNQGEGLWGRTDDLTDGGWVAFTTEPKNPAYAWAVHHHPDHGRTVLLLRDDDMSSLHHDWMYGHNGFLYRHGGYWWDGTAWHRPSQVVDHAFEGYDARPVQDALTVTAADLLTRPGTPDHAHVVKIAAFTALEKPLSDWHDHLALWAARRQRDSRPLDQCVVDLRTPELDPARFVDREGLAKIANMSSEELPHPERGRRDLPPAQTETPAGPLWSQPVAQDWAEQRRRTHGPRALLSGRTTEFGTDQPLGLVADHNHLTKIIRDGLEDDRNDGKRRLGFAKPDLERTAATLAWWPAVALTEGPNSLIPISAVRTAVIEAVLGGLARDVNNARKRGRNEVSLGDIRRDVVALLDWYIQRKPDHTPRLFGEICLEARLRFELSSEQVGHLLQRSLYLDSALDHETINSLLDLALPPSAQGGDDS